MAERIEIQQVLSEECSHPNIIKLHHIFHSETHLLFQMENGGPHDLYVFFSRCHRRNHRVSALTTQAVLSQLIAGVTHMHIVAEVAHRDIKPENIIVSGGHSDGDIKIKVADFDTSVLNPGEFLSGAIGTFPFTAPEVMLEKRYRPYAADIWSTAIVILEVLCRMQILEHVLQLDSGQGVTSNRRKRAIREQMTHKIRYYFSNPDAVAVFLKENIRAEARCLMCKKLIALLEGMLDVAVDRRLRSREVRTTVAELDCIKGDWHQMNAAQAGEPDSAAQGA
jgi:serine/threonine protein kinase